MINAMPATGIQCDISQANAIQRDILCLPPICVYFQNKCAFIYSGWNLWVCVCVCVCNNGQLCNIENKHR